MNNIPSLKDKDILFDFILKSCNTKDLEKKTFNEVFTPQSLINEILTELEKYIPDLFTNKNRTFFDPCAGIGNFFIALYYKLMDNLDIKDENEREKHILEKMLYMGEINSNNYQIIKKIFNPNNKFKLNLYKNDTSEGNIKKYFNKLNFDVIITNPPFNKPNSTAPLYNIFIENYIDKCQYLTFILPSRWISKNSKVKKFKNFMFERNDIVFINHNSDVNFFQKVELMSGFNYFLKDSNYNGLVKFNNNLYNIKDLENILLDESFKINNQILNLIDKLKNHNKLINIYNSMAVFNIESNDKRLTNSYDKNKYKCYVSTFKNKDRIQYIDKNEIKNVECLGKYKIITVRANGHLDNSFGFMKKILPYEIHNKTYMNFSTNNENEADYLLSYLKCKLPYVLLFISKKNQHISKNTLELIPLPPLDRIWNDEEIYNYFDIIDFKDLIDYIYSKIKK